MRAFDPVFLGGAIRTLHAPRWKLWAAKLFGERIVGADADYEVVGYMWRGKMYVTDAGRTTEPR
jgi:hypothetical protein